MKITVKEAKQEDVLAKLKGLDGVKDAGKVLADLKDMGFTGIDSGTYVFSGNSYIVMEHPDGMYAELDYTTEPGGDVPAEVKSYDYFKDIEDYKLHHGGNAPRESCKKSESKKNEAAVDNPQKIYRIKSLFTDVYEDDWEDGEGEHVNSWSGSDVLGRKMYKEFSSLGDILRMLNSKYLYIWKDSDNIKNWAIFEDPDLKDEIRFDCETMVDVDNNVADESDLEAWKNGRKKLFNAHSILYVTAEYTIPYVSAEELMEDAKKIGLDTI